MDTKYLFRAKHLQLFQLDSNELSFELAIVAALYSHKVDNSQDINVYKEILQKEFKQSNKKLRHRLPKYDEICDKKLEIVNKTLDYETLEYSETEGEEEEEVDSEEERQMEEYFSRELDSHVDGEFIEEPDQEDIREMRKLKIKTCGLTIAQLLFLAQNCEKHDFEVTIVGYQFDNIYTIIKHLGRCGKRQPKTHSITLLKVDLACQLDFFKTYYQEVESAGLTTPAMETIHQFAQQEEFKKEAQQALKSELSERQKACEQRAHARHFPKNEQRHTFDTALREDIDTLDPSTTYFFYIKNPDCFFRDAYKRKANGPVSYAKNVTCLTCFQPVKIGHMQEHEKNQCLNRQMQMEKMPAQSEVDCLNLDFTNYIAQEAPEIMIFFDFEAEVKNNDTTGCEQCQDHSNERVLTRCKCQQHGESTHSVEVHTVHKPISYCWIAVDRSGTVLVEKEGDPAKGDDFVKDLLDYEEYFESLLKKNVPLTMNEEECYDYYRVTHCIICREPFDFVYDKYAEYRRDEKYIPLRALAQMHDNILGPCEKIVKHHNHET